MKKTMSSYNFVDDMMDIRPDNFTREGLFALYDYFMEYEDSCGTEIEFDPIAICCGFTEDSIENHLSNYGLSCLEQLEDNTTVIMVDEDNCIIQNY